MNYFFTVLLAISKAFVLLCFTLFYFYLSITLIFSSIHFLKVETLNFSIFLKKNYFKR